jgi:hypothetical protein
MKDGSNILPWLSHLARANLDSFLLVPNFHGCMAKETLLFLDSLSILTKSFAVEYKASQRLNSKNKVSEISKVTQERCVTSHPLVEHTRDAGKEKVL